MNWEQARSAALRRDEYTCTRCSKPATDAHHRKVKGMGGTSDPEIAIGAANLVSLCRDCHSWCHAHPAEAYRLGFLVHSWDSPEKVSIIRKSGGLVWLKQDGTRAEEDIPAYF